MAVPEDPRLGSLTQGAVDVITPGDLAAKLATGRRLRVKLGLDPTASDLHLGHAVVLRTLRRFQDAGHVAVLILGDFTARVGDPSGKSATRPRLSKEEVDAAATTYVEQLARILDPDPCASRCGGTPNGSRPWASRTCCGSRRAQPSPGCSSVTTSPTASPRACPSR
jgi:tyrosyl-tRNA synthetase